MDLSTAFDIVCHNEPESGIWEYSQTTSSVAFSVPSLIKKSYNKTSRLKKFIKTIRIYLVKMR